MSRSYQLYSMHVRLMRPGFWGGIIGFGANGLINVQGRSVTWTVGTGSAATVRWQVDAGEITNPSSRPP